MRTTARGLQEIVQFELKGRPIHVGWLPTARSRGLRAVIERSITIPMPPILFYDWPYSPFCMKVRAVLDYKMIEYRAVNPLAHLHDIARRGKIGKLPALEIGGKLIVDSTDIAYALDSQFPEPPLLPQTPHERGLAHAIEDWADESLYFIGLYYRWFEPEGRKPVAGVFGKSLKGRLLYRFYLHRILGQLRGQGTLRKPQDHVLRDLDRHLEAVEALLTPGPYVLGAKPYLCDFALWGQLNYLSRTPVGAAFLRERPIVAKFIERTGKARAHIGMG